MKKLLILICLLWSTIIYAEDLGEENFKKYNLMMMSYPMMCGSPDDVNRYIEDNKLICKVSISTKNVATNPDYNGSVEFAIKMPGSDNSTLWLPIDSKFPTEPYEVLLDKYESGIQIQMTQLQGVVPPAPVADSFNEVNRAKQEEETLVNESNQ